MSKKSRAKYQAKKKHTKTIANMSRRQAQMALELEAARAQLQKEIPIMDRLLNDTRNLARHVLFMENRLKSTVTQIEIGAYIEEPLMTRDEYIIALQKELKKIEVYKATTLNPMLKRMLEVHAMKDTAEQLLGEAEMQLMIQDAYRILSELSEEVADNTESLNLQKALKIDTSMDGVNCDTIPTSTETHNDTAETDTTPLSQE